MLTDPQLKPSFSAGRRWVIALQVLVLTTVVLAVLAMANYISRDYFVRLQVSARNRVELSPMTLSLLKSLTNQVHATIYYDKEDPLYESIYSLLHQYELQSPRHVSVQTVDYLLDAGTAQKVKQQYNLGVNTNLIIFDCAGAVQVLPGSMLADYTVDMHRKEGPERRLVDFRGEKAFTAALLAVTESKVPHAYVLQGHGEHSITSGNDEDGYLRFAELLNIFHVAVQPLDNLYALNEVPTNCDLLIIPGPHLPISAAEVDKIGKYLDRSGSRLLLLLAANPQDPERRLEGLLYTNWNVRTSWNTVEDPEHSPGGGQVVVGRLAVHPVTSPLYEENLEFGRPRAVDQRGGKNLPPDAPHVQVLAETEPTAHLSNNEAHKGRIPLMVAVEKTVPGVATERGPNRMVVVGDSLCLANHWISGPYANRNFAVCAVNWLLDRTPLIQIGPHPVNQYTLEMTQSQLQSTELILLAGMPGGVLALGCLVWLRRRR